MNPIVLWLQSAAPTTSHILCHLLPLFLFSSSSGLSDSHAPLSVLLPNFGFSTIPAPKYKASIARHLLSQLFILALCAARRQALLFVISFLSGNVVLFLTPETFQIICKVHPCRLGGADSRDAGSLPCQICHVPPRISELVFLSFARYPSGCLLQTRCGSWCVALTTLP